MMWKHFIRIVHFDAEGMIVEWIRWWCGFGWLFGSIVWISGRFGHYQDYYQSEKDCFIFVYIKVYRFITCDDAMMMMIRMTKYQNQTQVHDDHDGNGSKRPHTAALSFFWWTAPFCATQRSTDHLRRLQMNFFKIHIKKNSNFSKMKQSKYTIDTPPTTSFLHQKFNLFQRNKVAQIRGTKCNRLFCWTINYAVISCHLGIYTHFRQHTWILPQILHDISKSMCTYKKCVFAK